MGLILPDAAASLFISKLGDKGRAGRVKRAIARIEDQPRGCDNCPLQEQWGRISSPQMPISGNTANGDILAFGEGPGEEEDTRGEAFVGKAGKFLREHIPYRHLDRMAFTNAVRCRPPGNRTPTVLETHCCSIYLEEDIEKYNFKVILGIGGAALSRFIPSGEASLTQMVGVKFPIEIGSKSLWYYPVFHPSYLLHNGGDRAPQFPVFSSDMRRFFKQVDSWKAPICEHPKAEDVICVYNKEDAYDLYRELSPERVMGIDLETSCLRAPERDARLLSGALSDGDLTFAFPCDHPSASNDWGLALLLKASEERVWVAHNAAFELGWLWLQARRNGIEWKPKRFEDSMALGRLHNARESLLGLDIMSHIALGINVKKLTNIDPTRILEYPIEEILPYNGLDAWGSVKIFERWRSSVDDYNYNHILGAIRSTTQMELLGLPVNLDVARELEKEWGGKASRLQQEARAIYEAKAYEREYQEEFNIGSPEQLGIALTKFGNVKLPNTPSGKSSTDDSVLGPVAEKNPLARCALNYREAKKHSSTYIKPVLRVPERFQDGMIHPCYSTMLVSTLRHSSTDPNAQNYPKRRHRELRRQIEAPPGHVIVACDMGQLEARVYAMASKDRKWCESIIRKEDIHSFWLHRALELYPDYMLRLREMTNQSDDVKVLKGGRDTIKSDLVFASLYGATAQSCSDRTGIPLHITRDLLDEFWQDHYPEALQWLKARRKEYQEIGGAYTLTGRLRLGVLSGNEPINTPIQGTAADLVIDAQNELSELAFELDDMYLHPRINVHDDLTFILPEQDDRLEEYIFIIADAMTRVRFKWQIVPLSVEIKMGKNWCDLDDDLGTIIGDYVH